MNPILQYMIETIYSLVYFLLLSIIVVLAFPIDGGFATFPENVQKKVNAIHGHGTSIFTDEELFLLFSGNNGVSITADSIRSGAIRILEGYSENGYPFTTLDSLHVKDTGKGITLEVFITEALPLLVQSVHFEGNQYFADDDLVSWFGIKPGNVWQKIKIQNGLDHIEDEYSEAGFPFCRADIKDTFGLSLENIVSAGLPLVVTIDEGREGRVDSIVYEGLNYTRLSLLNRHIGLEFGERVNKKQLDAAERNLNRLTFLDYVSSPEWVLFSDNKTGLLFQVQEGSPNHFSGILGYIPSRGRGSSGVVTGDITVHLGNLFGTGRSMTGKWARRDEVSRDFDFRYHEPWLFGSMIDLDLFFGQAIQDSSYLRRGMGISSSYRLTPSFTIKASIEKFSTLPEVHGEEVFQLMKFSSLEGNFGLSYDSRDHPTNPRKGMYNNVTLRMGRRQGGVQVSDVDKPDEGKVFDRSILTDLAYALPVTRRQVVYLYFHGAQMSSGGRDIPYSQWFAMGGARSLRGYRELQFRSTSVGWWNLEYRFLPERLSRFFVFFDGGFYKISSDPVSEWRRKYGYGVGFRINSRLGIIGMDYGIGEESGPSTGKIHLSIENRF